jgi:hypothetical protein
MAEDEWHPVNQAPQDEWRPVGGTGTAPVAQSLAERAVAPAIEAFKSIPDSAGHPWDISAPWKAIQGAFGIMNAPIQAASMKIEDTFPKILEAQKQGQIIGLQSPADIVLDAMGLTEPVRSFNRDIVTPATQRLDSFARTGDANGVRLDPPLPETKPSQITPIENSPFQGVPRSILAKTGVPEIDSILFHPTVQSVIDNPVVDRSHTIPYEAGGSVPLERPTTYLDEHVPDKFTVSRLSDPSQKITFDPADPTIIHENTEEFAMDLLIKGGMKPAEAYRVAHFEIAEKAEHAWYTANDIDPAAAEAEWDKIQPGIQHEIAADTPKDLYTKEYPGADVTLARHEEVFESQPTPEEVQRAFDILRNAPELRPKSAQPMLQQARELGVITDDTRPALNELPPREAGQQAMAARQPPPDKVIGEVGGRPEQSEWRKRWERTLDRMGVAGDARDVINSVVDANDEFAQARVGNMSAGEVEGLASVTGLDSTRIDVGGTSSKIKNNVELRNTTEAFRIVHDKIKRAAEDLAAKHGVDDEAEMAEMTRLELQRDLLLDTTVASKELIALRAEFGRSGNTLNELRKAMAEANGLRDFLKEKQGRTPDDVRERARMINDTPADALPKVLEATRQPQKPGWLFWTWQNGLISGPITHSKYLFVNTATVYLERVIAPELAAIIGKMRGDNVSLMAPLWANVGMYKGLGDAFKAAGQAFKSGLRVPLESEVELTRRAVENPELKGAQTPYTQNLGPDWGIWKRVFNEDQLAGAAKVLGIPGRSANLIHTFYKVLSERGAAASRAYEAAFAEGVKGDEFADRYNYHLANPTNEALQATIDDAYSGAFMEKLGDKSGSLARALATNPVTKWMFPFQHIPWNIERMGVKYSPAALFTLLADTKMGSALKGDLGHSAQNLALAKTTVGSAVLGYFIDKALSGVATPDYPTDPKDIKTRRQWQLLGIQPNSLQIGDQWVEMNRLGPVGNVARIGANLGSIIKNYNGADDHALLGALWNGAMAAVNQVADETGFQTLRNMIDVIDGKQDPARFLAWQGGSLLPFSSFLSQNASIVDPDMRKANDFVSSLKYRIPGLRETDLPKRDPLFGEPVPNPGYHTLLRESPVNKDPTKAELDRIGYYPTAPQKTIGHVKLNDEQYDRYEATAGPLVKQMLSAAINTPAYKQLPTGQQEAMVKGIIAAGRARARQAMQMAYPELIQQGIDARTRQISGTATGTQP